ncbi:ABC transporter permease [Bartonella sp. HY038]|uniref:ABC transporter permease n=1 Tax=Bartonella sp. HY038 TaxID=2759660 RepID=UPI0015FBF304|nr:ABC transporter permease [Bartonella sp. HY038]
MSVHLTQTKLPLKASTAKLKAFYLGILGLAILVFLWWFAIDIWAKGNGFAARFSPSLAFPAFWHLLQSPDLILHVGASLKRILVGLFFALILGIPLELMVGCSTIAAKTTSPAFQFLRMISPLSWMPIAVMVFGVGDKPIYFLIAFAAIWPILLNTAAGVNQLDRHWLQLAKSLAATKVETLFFVILPGIFGQIFVGLRLAIGIAWIVIVPAEMLGVNAGLGYFILDARDRLDYPELMAIILLIGIIGYSLDSLARLALKYFGASK